MSLEAAATTTTTTAAPETDAFAAAFAQFAAPEVAPAASTETQSSIQLTTDPVVPAPTSSPDLAPPDKTVEAGTPPAAGASGERAPAQPASGEAESPAAATPAATEAQTPADPDAELLERFAKIVQKQAEAAPPAAQTPQAPQTTEQQPQTAQPPLYTDAETKVIQDYFKDYEDIARAEDLLWRQRATVIANHIFQQVTGAIAPYVEAQQAVVQRLHLQDLQSTVQDYDDIRDKVVDWVGKQPAYLQVAYNHVIKQGTTDEIVDLIDRYRRDTGAPAPQLTQAAAPAAPKKATELPPAAKQAAAELAPVSTKRTAVTTGADPNDYDAAFAAFASKPD